MDPKENDRFNTILINGYEELLREKPANPEAHYIYHLLKNIAPEIRKSDSTLNAFFEAYHEELKNQKPDPESLFANKSQFYNENSEFDYDYFVIGAGEPAITSAIIASKFGKRVAIAEYVLPSTQGSTWDFGGTSLNSSCVPKKLMYISKLSSQSREAETVEWEVEGKLNSWNTAIGSINKYVRELRVSDKLILAENSVKFYNTTVRFIDSHSLELYDPKKSRFEKVTAKYIVLALEARPTIPEDIQGAKEFGITTDDLFLLRDNPSNLLIVGGSFIALELAGFLRSIGVNVTIITRGSILKQVDQDIVAKIVKDLESRGVKILTNTVVQSIQQTPEGKKKVNYKSVQNGSEEFDTVLFATGRQINPSDIAVEAAGINIDPTTKLINTNERDETNVSHIYAIGDLVSNKPRFLHTTLQAALLLPKRLFGNSSDLMDYIHSPKVMFTPLEYSSVGLTEDAAVAQYGRDQIVVCNGVFNPSQGGISKARKDENCFIKAITKKNENGKVVGLHVTGPHALDVVNLFVTDIANGATWKTLLKVVGIRPIQEE